MKYKKTALVRPSEGTDKIKKEKKKKKGNFKAFWVTGKRKKETKAIEEHFALYVNVKSRTAIVKLFAFDTNAKNQNGNCKAFCVICERNKTATKEDQENSAHRFGDNYLTNHLVTFLQDRIKP